MRTTTFEIREYNEEETGHGFTVVETEILHVVTGDEYSHYELPIWFDTRADAQAFIDAEVASL
jgi:hypothetical protein